MTTKIYQNLIGGKWVSAESGKTFLNHNPANVDDVVGEFQASGEADVDRAVQAARAAYRQLAAGSGAQAGRDSLPDR
jgi:acyl-CoA reductase-like NAD-dependent aldehyde dehydrogenase